MYYDDVKDRSSPMKPVYDFYKSLDTTRLGSEGLRVLDLGCGPVIANVISAAEFASEIILAEYTELNRKEFTIISLSTKHIHSLILLISVPSRIIIIDVH